MMGFPGTGCGVTPRLCEELFSRIASKEQIADALKKTTYSVKISFLEIYNHQRSLCPHPLASWPIMLLLHWLKNGGGGGPKAPKLMGIKPKRHLYGAMSCLTKSQITCPFPQKSLKTNGGQGLENLAKDDGN